MLGLVLFVLCFNLFFYEMRTINHEVLLHNRILPSLAFSITITLILYFNAKPSFMKKSSRILTVFCGGLIVVFILPVILLNIFDSKSMAIFLEDIHVVQSYYEKEENPHGYYRLKLLYIIEQNRIRPIEIYEIIDNEVVLYI